MKIDTETLKNKYGPTAVGVFGFIIGLLLFHLIKPKKAAIMQSQVESGSEDDGMGGGGGGGGFMPILEPTVITDPMATLPVVRGEFIPGFIHNSNLGGITLPIITQALINPYYIPPRPPVPPTVVTPVSPPVTVTTTPPPTTTVTPTPTTTITPTVTVTPPPTTGGTQNDTGKKLIINPIWRTK